MVLLLHVCYGKCIIHVITPYEKILNIEQLCVFWYITMTMKFHLFKHLLTNQVHNIFCNETYILIYVTKNSKNIDFPSK